MEEGPSESREEEIDVFAMLPVILKYFKSYSGCPRFCEGKAYCQLQNNILEVSSPRGFEAPLEGCGRLEG